jgi:hypothetical protein
MRLLLLASYHQIPIDTFEQFWYCTVFCGQLTECCFTTISVRSRELHLSIIHMQLWAQVDALPNWHQRLIEVVEATTWRSPTIRDDEGWWRYGLPPSKNNPRQMCRPTARAEWLRRVRRCASIYEFQRVAHQGPNWIDSNWNLTVSR